MKFKVDKERFKSRTPLCIRKRYGMLYFQTQIEIAQNDGLRAGIYCEYAKVESEKNEFEIGSVALNLINRFNMLSDMTDDEFYKFKCVSIEEYKKNEDMERLNFMEATDYEDLELNYEECSVKYTISSGKYEFYISWFDSNKKRVKNFSKSTGEEGNLIFDKPLEFDENITASQLGAMISEAFDRGIKMTDKSSGNYYPTKNIELLDESVLEITAPSDDHFVDYEDNGMSEVYQLYSYITKKSDQASAYFALTVAPEIYGDLSKDTIYSDWISAYGEADEITVTQKEYGIFNFRAQMKNKKVYRIAYFAQCQDNLILECCMEIPNPAKKKKLVESLPILFEQFAFRCKKAIDK